LRNPLRHGQWATPPRGQSLVVVVILLAIITVIAVSLMSRNSDEIDAAGSKRRYDESVSCAEGARQMLVSQFSTFGVTPTSLSVNSTVGSKVYSSGHYDTFNVKTVAVASGGAGRSVGVSDATNRTMGTRLGGSLYRMTVVCSDSTVANRQSEVEFLIRFGL
jgi:hypothetical protein